MISTSLALQKLLKLAKEKDKESICIQDCSDRVLATSLVANHDQPPFCASAMDGYAIKKQSKVNGAKFKIVGQSAAGDNYKGKIKLNEAVRIFTGAPVPEGADCVIIQEDVYLKNEYLIVNQNRKNNFVREKGSDFSKGYTLKAPVKILPAMVSLIASMNYNSVSVYQKPSVAIITTGNELVEPGGNMPPNKIIASNSYGLAAMLKSFGADPKIFPIVSDNMKAIKQKLELASKFDLILTIGGVSVGKYDLVLQSAESSGLKLAFHKVAMKPGKPLLAGQINKSILIGLPGNPISSLLTCYTMVKPVIEKMLGLNESDKKLRLFAQLGANLEKNGKREHFQRAILKCENENLVVYPMQKHDSSLITEFNRSNSIIKRAPDAPAKVPGQTVEVIPFYAKFC